MSTAVRRALYGKLAGDTTLRSMLGAPGATYGNSIYHNNAPADASYPFLVFNKQAGTPTDTFGDPGALDEEIWQVRTVDENDSADAAEAVARRIAYLLNDAVLSLANDEDTGRSRSLTYLRRASDVEFSEVDGGKTYHHVGALFRVVWT